MSTYTTTSATRHAHIHPFGAIVHMLTRRGARTQRHNMTKNINKIRLDKHGRLAARPVSDAPVVRCT